MKKELSLFDIIHFLSMTILGSDDRLWVVGTIRTARLDAVALLVVVLGHGVVWRKGATDGSQTGQCLSKEVGIVLHPGERVEDVAEQHHG